MDIKKEYIYPSFYFVVSLVSVLLTIHFYHPIQSDRINLQAYRTTSSELNSSAKTLEKQITTQQKNSIRNSFFNQSG